MIVVLINDTVKKYLLKQPTAEKKRIRNKFEFLETGIWDGGLKVKKLKGLSSKYVFEARLDKGNRILFTLGHPPGDNQTLLIYVWGISQHDDVSRKSKTIIPFNVPFLQFSDYEESFLEDVEMEKLQQDYFTQEAITQKVNDESGSQKWYPLDEPEWKRLQMYQRDDLEFFLFLTPEQKEILQTPLPLMISGTSGSGKTTLSVYYLLNKNLNNKKKLFITYNTLLKNYARRLYNGLLEEREWKNETVPPLFYTFKELCLEMAGEDRFPPGQEVDFNRFKQLLSTYTGRVSLDPALLWEEIRGIIKGAVPRMDLSVLEKAGQALKKGPIPKALLKALQEQFILFSKLDTLDAPRKFVRKYLRTGIEDFAANIETVIHNPELEERVASMLDKTLHALEKKEGIDRTYLSFPEYESLGKKKAPNFAFNRQDIYRVFEWYRDKLNSEHLWDESDFIPQTIPEKYSCDVLVCDEVQDFTDTQLDLLFTLVKNPNNIFLAGDTKQTINPSGFRWEEVRKHFYERGLQVPELKNLSLNFRSSGSIVQLSNTLLQLKEKFTGKKAEESVEEWRYKGRPVTVISGVRVEGMLDILRVSGARRTILVRSDEEKKTLKERLGTELVFTIEEAKGLEFETVVLWKFCADSFSEDVWKVTLDLSARRVHQAHIRHEINLLYVGITRSQRDLLIYDGPLASVIWQSEPIRDHVYITEDRDFIRGMWEVVTSPGEWEQQGRYFFEREFYKAAAECFKNAGNTAGHTRALAHHSRQTGDFLQAALYFEQLPEKADAAECYEKAGQYKKALVLWEGLNQNKRVSRLRPRVLEQEGRFAEAGRLYLEKGKFNEALACFKRAKEYRQMADIYLEHLEDEKKAAQYYEEARDFEKAALLYLRLNMEDKAAELYFRNKNYAKAEALWKENQNTKQLIELYKETGRDEELLALYEKDENFEKAVKYLRSRKMDETALRKEADQMFEQGEYFKAVIRFHVLEDPGKIADCYLKMEKYKEAAPHLEDDWDFLAAADAYYKAGDYVEAFDIYVSSEGPENDFAKSREVLKKIDNKEDLGHLGMKFYRREDWQRAAFIFSQAGVHPAYEGLCHAFMGDREKANDIWLKKALTMFSLHVIAAECIEHEVYEIAAEFYLTFPSYGFKFPAFYFERKSLPWSVMETYFGERKHLIEEQSRWGRFLVAKDNRFKSSDEITRFFARSEDYCGLVIYLNVLKQHKMKNYKAFIHHYKNRVVLAEKEKDYKNAVFYYFVLERFDQVHRLLPRLTLNRYNFCFFLAPNGEKEKRLEVYRWCLDNDYRIDLREYLILVENRERLEELYQYEKESAGKDYEEPEEWDWEFERVMLFIEKQKKQGNKGDYGFFSQEDMDNVKELLEAQKQKIE